MDEAVTIVSYLLARLDERAQENEQLREQVEALKKALLQSVQKVAPVGAQAKQDEAPTPDPAQWN